MSEARLQRTREAYAAEHCDLHGPYTAWEAAQIVLGNLSPIRTGHLCEGCKRGVEKAAKVIADRIDAMATDHVYAQVYP